MNAARRNPYSWYIPDHAPIFFTTYLRYLLYMLLTKHGLHQSHIPVVQNLLLSTASLFLRHTLPRHHVFVLSDRSQSSRNATPHCA